jgi:RNA polymerase sigma-70 factor (ECF subfamily)
MNNAFLTASRKWAGYQANRSTLTPYVWLYCIVRDTLSEAADRHFKREMRSLDREQALPDDLAIELGLGLIHSATSPSEAAAREELRERMRHALAALKEQDREILWMRHFDQLSSREAADVLGIKQPAAEARYARALIRLTQLWERLYPSR